MKRGVNKMKQLKKVLSILCVIALLFSSIAFAFAENSNEEEAFNDSEELAANQAAEEAAKKAAEEAAKEE